MLFRPLKGGTPLSPSNDLFSLFEQAVSQFSQGKGYSTQNVPKTKDAGCTNVKKNISVLQPQKLLVILGLLAGVLEVDSILVDRDQVVQILLEGSLRRKTKLDKMLDEIGEMPFDDVLRAIINRG